MEKLNLEDRIKYVRKTNGYKQDAFADTLNLNRNSVSLMENGKLNPSDRTLKDICEKFSVNFTWLKYGEGDMKVDLEDDFVYLSAKISEKDDPELKELTKILWTLEPEELKVLKGIVKKIKNSPVL